MASETEKLLCLLTQLQSHRLTVALVPQRRFTNHGGMIRVCLDKGPPWYRELCATFPSSRGTRRGKPDTRIRRQNIERVLCRLVNGQASWSKYTPAIKALAKKHFKESDPF